MGPGATVISETDRSILFAREILKETVVEDEINCLKDAKKLLVLVDKIIKALRHDASARSVLRSPEIERPCFVCGLGIYNLVPKAEWNFGPNAGGAQTARIMSCSRCGHVQIFKSG